MLKIILSSIVMCCVLDILVLSECEYDVILTHVESDSGSQVFAPSALCQEETTGTQSVAHLTQLGAVD